MNLEPQWIVGFVDGEGCFHIGITAHAEMTMGVQILPEFMVVQHQRDVQILHALKAHFGCGVVRKNHADRMAFRVRKFEHLRNIIVPFFMQHSLKSKKNTEFKKFCQVLTMMEKRMHLTPDGVAQIKLIAARMNNKALVSE